MPAEPPVSRSDVAVIGAGPVGLFTVFEWRPRYTARLAISVVEDTMPGSEIGIMYPDVEVLRRDSEGEQASSPAPFAATASPVTLTIPVVQPIEVRLVNVEIRDTA